MKKNLLHILTVFICISFYVSSQSDISPDKYLFNKFINGTVLMKNKAIVSAPLNYDWVKQEMNYYDNDERMVLQGLETIDTVYIANRKFIPHGKTFLELWPVQNDILYIEWKARVVNKGKKGAMGVTSHAVTSREMDVSNMRGQGVERKDIYVHDSVSDNSYYIRVENKLKKFNSEKTFLKLFPEKKAINIKSYIKEHKIDLKKMSDVIKAVDYVFGLD